LSVDSSTQIHISANATSTNTGGAILVAPYGVGDGSTTFNVPDLRGRVVAGRDDMGGTAASRLTGTTMSPGGTALGATGGEQTHTLVTSEMPSHTHALQIPTNGSANCFTPNANAPGTLPNTSTVTTASRGGDGAHNNVQPTLIVNYIIATVDQGLPTSQLQANMLAIASLRG
jgi:microcystin-dependent protein